MALSNYTDLQTAVAQWMKRSDVASKVPDYITLAEKKIVKLAKLRTNEPEVTLVGTPGVATIALPSDFESVIGLWDTTDDPRTQVIQTLPEALPVDAAPNTPDFFAIDGENIRFECPLDSAYTYAFRYRQKFSLSDSNPTNYVLTEYPDVYLYGALVEGFMEVFDQQNAVMWQERFKSALDLMISAEGARNKKVALRTDVQSAARFDINRGE